MQPSDKILLGLYRLRPVLNDDLALETGHLAWLINKGADGWIGESGPLKLEYPANKGSDISYLERPLKDKSRVSRELSFLTAKNCVSFTAPKGFDHTFRIALLPEGFLRGEKLNSCLGRADLLYSDHKDGIIGVLLTIVVSALTSVITTLLTG
jgi:hypothetical protein